MVTRTLKLPSDRSFFLFGPRQTGKTTLINSAFQDNVYKVNLLLSEQYFKYSKDPSLLRREVMEKTKSIKYVFIDEIQRVPELLNEVQYLIDSTSLHFVMSGSSARKLKRGYANLLGGRAVQRFLFPFMWHEVSGKAQLTGLKSFREDYLNVPCYVVCNADEPYRLGDVLVMNWREFLGKVYGGEVF